MDGGQITANMHQCIVMDWYTCTTIKSHVHIVLQKLYNVTTSEYQKI